MISCGYVNLLAWVVCGCLWLFSRFCSQLLGRFCGCLWFGGYVNFVEIFGFVIVGFGGFGGFQWQWVCECLLRWVETLRLSVVGGC